jgi:fructokinase
MTEKRPWIFGEVLFDCFPDGSRVLGGAPFNVAWHLQAFGLNPLFLSRVGADPAGDEIRAAMQAWRMDDAGLQTDEDLPTGQVSVTLEQGEPHYRIDHPVAYDRIRPTPGSESAGLLYHGSLALRDAESRGALDQILEPPAPRIFIDVNLRAPWWQAGEVMNRVRQADWIKLNEDELEKLAPGLDAPGFLQANELAGLILTRGEQGAECLLADGEAVHVQPVRNGNVVDTVGAGDALAAVMICGLMRDWAPATSLSRAQEFASAICTQRGATVREFSFYRQFLDRWQIP